MNPLCLLTLIFFPPHSVHVDAMRDNDWICPNCGNINFSFRIVCNMRNCNIPKPGSQVCSAFLLQYIRIILEELCLFMLSPLSYNYFLAKFYYFATWLKNSLLFFLFLFE